MSDRKSIFDFTNIFSREITLRFKLEPVIINSKGEAEKSKTDYYRPYFPEDEKLYNQYSDLKYAIDAYHRIYIDKWLKYIIDMPFSIANNKGEKVSTGKEEFIEKINEYIRTFKDNKGKDNTSTKSMRVFIHKILVKDKATYDNFGKSDFVARILKDWLEQEGNVVYNEDQEPLNKKILGIIEKDGAKQYVNCRGVLEARKLMYDPNGTSMSVPYRCINRNLPRFAKNYHLFKQIEEERLNVFDFKQLDSDFHEELHQISELSGRTIKSVTELFQPELYIVFMNQDGINCLNTIIGKKQEKGSASKGLNQYINEYNQKAGKKRKKDGIQERNLFQAVHP